MLALLEFLVWLLILPYVLFGLLLAKIAAVVSEIFEPHLLLAGVWLGSMGMYLIPRRVPDDMPFVGLVDAIAQSHMLGFSTPVVMLVGAAGLVLIAAVVALRRKTRG